MGTYDELYSALLTSHAASRSRVRTDEEVARELSELRAEVATLRRALAALVGFLEEEETATRAGRLKARVLNATRREPLEDDEPEVDALGSSPYRGAVPAPSARGCAICGKRLDPDDPELTLAARGSVCLGCFQRGG